MTMEKPEKSRNGNQKQPIKYWLVEITLTSGEDLQFYVSAKDQFHAYEKADEYCKLADNKELTKLYKGFKLFP